MPRSEHLVPLDGITLCMAPCGYFKESTTAQGGTRRFCFFHGHKLRRDDLACDFFTVEAVQW